MFLEIPNSMETDTLVVEMRHLSGMKECYLCKGVEILDLSDEFATL